MTIPTLMNNTQESQYKVAYKKAYSTISQAFSQASQDNSLVPLTGQFSYQGGEEEFNVLKEKFVVVKSCTTAELNACWDTTGEWWRSEAATPAFIDKSGMAWKLRHLDSSSFAPTILVDTNGHKKPNKYGYDRFQFLFATVGGYSFGATDMGIPNRIIPFVDVDLAGNTSGGFAGACPSAAKHTCYFQSWIIGD